MMKRAATKKKGAVPAARPLEWVAIINRSVAGKRNITGHCGSLGVCFAHGLIITGSAQCKGRKAAIAFDIADLLGCRGNAARELCAAFGAG